MADYIVHSLSETLWRLLQKLLISVIQTPIDTDLQNSSVNFLFVLSFDIYIDAVLIGTRERD